MQITMNRDLNSASSPDQCARVQLLLNCHTVAAPQTQAPPTPLHPPSSRLRIVHFGIGAGARSVASRGGRTAQRDGTARSLVQRASAAAAAACLAGGRARRPTAMCGAYLNRPRRRRRPSLPARCCAARLHGVVRRHSARRSASARRHRARLGASCQ